MTLTVRTGKERKCSILLPSMKKEKAVASCVHRLVMFPFVSGIQKNRTHKWGVDINNPVCSVILLENGVRQSLVIKGPVKSYFIH